MLTPPEVLAALLRSDPGRPRVTCYDDIASPPERIELSAKVLANWVSKAANCLVEEFDVQAGAQVRLDLPGLHWRTLYWALAVWSAGAEVTTDDDGDGDAQPHIDVAVSATQPDADIVVTLAALARSHPGGVAPGVLDEARELSTYGDAFVAGADPSGADWVTGGLPHGTRLALAGGPTVEEVLTAALRAWASDGSLVLLRGTDPATVAARCAAEGVTEICDSRSA